MLCSGKQIGTRHQLADTVGILLQKIQIFTLDLTGDYCVFLLYSLQASNTSPAMALLE